TRIAPIVTGREFPGGKRKGRVWRGTRPSPRELVEGPPGRGKRVPCQTQPKCSSTARSRLLFFPPLPPRGEGSGGPAAHRLNRGWKLLYPGSVANRPSASAHIMSWTFWVCLSPSVVKESYAWAGCPITVSAVWLEGGGRFRSERSWFTRAAD